MFKTKFLMKLSTGGIVIPPVDPGDIATPMPSEELFDVFWYGMDGRNSAGNLAIEGQSVYSIPNKKGNPFYDLVYTGDVNAAVLNGPPKKRGLSIFSENVPEISYGTGRFDIPIRLPFEHSKISINRPCQAGEAKDNNFGNLTYFGYVNGNTRAGTNNKDIIGSGVPDLFKITHEHVRLTASDITIWRDGVVRGSVPWTTNDVKLYCNWFGGTNMFSYDCYASYEKFGLLTDAQRSLFFADMAAKWKVGQEIQTAYAYNIQQQFNGSIWTCSFESKNLSGNVASFQYEWYVNIRNRETGGSFKKQKLVGTGPSLAKSAYASFLVDNNYDPTPVPEVGHPGDSFYIKVYVKALDSAGKGYGFVSIDGYPQEY